MSWGKKNYGMGEEKPFNFAQLLLERLNDLFKAANEARYNGDAFKWFNSLNSISSSVSFKYDNDQIKEMKKDLQNIRNKMKTAKNINKEIFFHDVEIALNDFEMKLVQYMFDFGLYYPKYEYKSWQEVIEEEDQ